MESGIYKGIRPHPNMDKNLPGIGYLPSAMSTNQSGDTPSVLSKIHRSMTYIDPRLPELNKKKKSKQ